MDQWEPSTRHMTILLPLAVQQISQENTGNSDQCCSEGGGDMFLEIV